MMVVIKTSLQNMPDYCDECQWYGSRPHPFKGWSEGCELMGHCMDDDQTEEWVYDGNGRPKACPLVNVPDTNVGDAVYRQAAIDAIVKSLCVKSEDYLTQSEKALLKVIKDLPSAQPEKVYIANITLSEEQIREVVEKAKNEVFNF